MRSVPSHDLLSLLTWHALVTRVVNKLTIWTAIEEKNSRWLFFGSQMEGPSSSEFALPHERALVDLVANINTCWCLPRVHIPGGVRWGGGGGGVAGWLVPW